MTLERFYNYTLYNGSLAYLVKRIENSCKLKKNNPAIINFINPHSYITSLKDYNFYKSLLNNNLNLIDGIGIYLYLKLFKKLKSVNRITGYDLFEKLIEKNLKFFFLGGNYQTSLLIKKKLKKLRVHTYSPSFSDNFSDNENKIIVKKINKFKPDILFVGMTAPKQEKWSYNNRHKLYCNYIINIGAVFDYFVNKYYRAPKIFRKIGLEWIFRLVQNPRLWKRTYSMVLYLFLILFSKKQNSIFFNIIDSSKKITDIINKNKSFVLTAFNLAFFSNIYSKKIKLTKHTVLWADGIFSKFFNNKIIKIPGYKLINDIKISSKYKSLHIIGNLNSKNIFFLKRKFKKKIIFSKLPFSNVKELCKQIPKVKKNSLVLLTLPTPKQEIISSEILKKYPFSKIICIGGGLNIASGSERQCPYYLSSIGLEFIWRLNDDTKRRFIRLSTDVLNLSKSIIKADIFAYSYKNET
jgi:N-acetylglucosaminyldiphosphoundecaprenol N-acetyl-beta-D-mannosaminyltransferase